MQQYNYPKLIWIKQNISFSCSNYRSNWQLTDNFCLHLSEPNRIETRRKRIVNRIVTTEPRWTYMMDVNINKMKVVHFRKSNTDRTEFNFKLGNNDIEIRGNY